MRDGGAVRRGARALRVGARVADNSIGAEGAGKLAAALQINSTITSLNLECACPSLDWTRLGSSTAPLPPLAPTAGLCVFAFVRVADNSISDNVKQQLRDAWGARGKIEL